MKIDYEQYLGNTAAYPQLDSQKVAEHLAQAVQCNTVSYADLSKMEGEGFLQLHQVLEQNFPLVHKLLKKEIINQWSLLFTWTGSDPSLEPVLFMGHLDTVPVTPGTEEDWEHGCFSGDIADGCVWGRGAMDCKSQVIATLEAAEQLLGSGYQPQRTIYLAFGHDEESIGPNGAESIMKLLKEREIHLDFVMDEGGGFTPGEEYGADGKLVVNVVTVEKGYADVRLICRSQGGHSSRPGKSTALGQMARAIVALEENPFAAGLCGPVKEFYQTIAPAVTQGPLQSALAHMDDQEEILLALLEENPMTEPYVRTTTAATMCQASPAPNVLPQRVEAVFNFRLSPLDSLDSLLAHIRSTVGDQVQVELIKGQEPSGTASTSSRGWNILKDTIQTYFPTALVAPHISTGGTDCRYFEEICENCYRFRPFIGEMYLKGLGHSTNEREEIGGLVHGIKLLIDTMKAVSAE